MKTPEEVIYGKSTQGT